MVKLYNRGHQRWAGITMICSFQNGVDKKYEGYSRDLDLKGQGEFYLVGSVTELVQ